MAESSTSPALELLYRRGMISGWWTAIPVALNIGGAAVLVLTDLSAADDPKLAFMAAYYACIAFFAHTYSVAWRTGIFFWQYLAMLVVVAQLSIASWLHIDASGAQWSFDTGLVREAATGGSAYVTAAVLDGLAAVLLLVHCTVLGFGLRKPRATAEVTTVSEEAALSADDVDAAAEAVFAAELGANSSVAADADAQEDGVPPAQEPTEDVKP